MKIGKWTASPSSLVATFFAIVSLIVFFALSSLAHAVQPASGADVCYAERACANKSTVSCIVGGPGCDAEVTKNGVLCTGELDNGTWGNLAEECPEG